MPMGGRPARGRESVAISPFLLASILAAMVSTAVLLVVWYGDSHPAVAGASPDRANLIVMVGVTSVSWASVLLALCRDTILRRMDDMADQLGQARTDLGAQVTAAATRISDHFTDTAAELAEQVEQSGIFRGLGMQGEPQPEDAGRVVAHPRLAEGPAPYRAR